MGIMIMMRLKKRENAEEEMEKDILEKMINSLNLEEQISYESIPNLDLYMDQVITLFEEKLTHTKRHEDDKLLTKTMINNYIKDKLLMPAVKKKYTKEHIVLMILLYEVKQILTIGDIKLLFSSIIKNEQVDAKLLKEMYQIYLEANKLNTSSFSDEVMAINDYVNERVVDLEDIPEGIEQEALGKMMQVILLNQKANYYKRLAEKIIDSQIIK